MQRKRGAVKHELVLATDLVDIDQRHAAFGHAGHGDVEAHLILVPRVGRAVGHNHQFGTGFGQAFHHIFVVAPLGPDVLADGNTNPHAAEIDRTGRRPRCKQAPLVEHAVVRQVYLQPHGGDDAAVEQAIGVVELAFVGPGRADQQRRAAAPSFTRKLFDLSTASRLERRLEHEVLGWVAGQEKLGQRQNIGTGTGGLETRAACLVGIAGNVADDGIELADCDSQPVAGPRIHNLGLARRALGRQSPHSGGQISPKRSASASSQAAAAMRSASPTAAEPISLI